MRTTLLCSLASGSKSHNVFKDGVWLWCFLSGGMFIAGCRKGATSAEQKLLPPETTNVLLSRLVERINSDPAAVSYYQNCVRQFGKARWDQALVITKANKMQCLLPMLGADSSTISVIAFEWSGLLRAKVFEWGRYGVQTDNEQERRIALALGAFNYKVTGRQPYRDNGIYYIAVKEVRQPAAQSVNRAVAYTLSICYEWTTCRGDGWGNCIGPLTYHSECYTDFLWAGEFDYAGYGGAYYDDPGSYGGGGGTSGGNTGETTIQFLAPRRPITSILAYLKCLDRNLPLKLIVYADQPVPGYNDPISITGGIGHAFVTIEQQQGSKLVRRSIGFYPATKVNPFNRTSADSQLGDDQDHPYDVAVAFALQPGATRQVLDAICYSNSIYDIEHYNCADFVIDIAAAGGIALPRTKGWWVVGSGVNPGDLGEDLRKMGGAMLNGTTRPNEGDCP
ncbi:hypothetical protein [Chitinophaga rhizosphaerae]|uniref:hypothetical protein n=1 Tax=Chitinophaga rhizosphaerae TaxID=1864947 RepID=UPI000F801DCB|nr:hypothetical protein [Chitinophaga rhizosphaerae]